jgi:hypothetical protein
MSYSSGASTTSPTLHYWINPDLHTRRHTSSDDDCLKDVECLCIGTGRFLRAVLVPLLQHHHTVIVQPRGRSFLEFMQKQQQQQEEANNNNNMYPVDTVLRNGQVETEYVACAAAYSWGREQDKQAFYQHLPSFVVGGISILGLGVTEAGLASHETPVMQDLYQLFVAIRDLTPDVIPTNGQNTICVINTDNVPNNGSTIQQHMLTLAAQNQDDHDDASTKMSMQQFFHDRVAFLNTMVDRITSQRSKDAPMIPRAEPIPAKALVVLDPDEDLPSWFTAMAMASTTTTTSSSSDEKKKKSGGGGDGLVIRGTAAQLENDVNLKLRIANGTHTAIAHVMALLKLTMTDALSSSPSSSLLMEYLDSLARDQILVAAAAASVARSSTGVSDKLMAPQEQALAVWEDWRLRLTHPHFGLSTFFITQNGPAKGGIRLTPTILDLLYGGNINNKPREDTTATPATTGIHVSMAFCFAVLLRWLTPASSKATLATITYAPPAPSGAFTGWLPKESNIQKESTGDNSASSSTTTVTYADGLQYNLDEGWYQFRCDCQVVGPDGITSIPQTSLSEWLAKLLVEPSSSRQQEPAVLVDAIRAYLLAPSGGNQGSIADTKAFAVFSQAVATLYARMVAGDCLLTMLQEMKECKRPYTNGFASDCSVMVVDGE